MSANWIGQAVISPLEIKKRRNARAWTQEQMAAKLGIDRGTYAQYENERVALVLERHHVSNLLLIAQGLECSVEELLNFPEPVAQARQPYYVEREEASCILENLKKRDAAVLVGPGQSGLTTVVDHILSMRSEAEPESCTLRLNLNTSQTRPGACRETFLAKLAEGWLGSSSRLTEADRELLLKARSNKPPVVFLESILHSLLKLHGSTLIVLENADVLADVGWCAEFFPLLRTWALRARTEQPWSGLQILLSLHLPAELIPEPGDVNSSFFYVASVMSLPDLSVAQVAGLSRAYGLRVAPQILGRLHALTGGHPLLVEQALRSALAREGGLGNLLLNPFAQNTPFLVYLNRIGMHLQAEQNRHLTPILEEIIRDPEAPPRLDQDAFKRLYRLGLLTGSVPTNYRLRCPLFASYLRRMP